MTAKSSWWSRNQAKVAPYVFISPFYILYAVFGLFPLGYSLYLSLFRTRTLSEREFVGLQNFINLVGDERFWLSVLNTTYYAIGLILILIPTSLFVAVLIHSRLVSNRMKALYRVGYFLPVITSAVVVAIVFRRVYDQRSGWLNIGLGLFGLPSDIPWLASKQWVMPAIILIALWQGVGSTSLQFTGGLQSIPLELVEAARIDGANSWQIFWHVTIPLLRPIIAFVCITSAIGSYSLFTIPFILTGGGPSDASLSMIHYLYIRSFTFSNFGYASTIGYALVAIVFTLSMIQFKLFGFGGASD